MKQIRTPQVIIIGAGLTGLTTAFYLKKRGIDFLLIEKMNQTGGVMQSRSGQGFVYEQGPSSGTLSRPEVVELFEDLDFEQNIEKATANSNSRWIRKNKNWHSLPNTLISGIRTPLFTWKDKINLLGEPLRKAGTDPNETIAQLVKRRMGNSFLDYAIDPFLGGIYAGDPNTIVTKYALPKLYQLEQTYGSFIKGAIRKAKIPKSEQEKKATKEIFSTKNGFSTLIQRLTDAVGKENIWLNCQQVQIIPCKLPEQHYQLTTDMDGKRITILASNIISTVAAPHLQQLFPFIPKNLMEQINTLRYAPVIQVSVAFTQWRGIDIDAFGGLIPSKENSPILGVLFPSSIFRNRATVGGALLSVFMGGMRRKDIFNLSDEQIKEILQTELPTLFKLPDYAPTFVKIFRYPYAIPQYEKTSQDRLKAIDNVEQQYRGLILAGNIRDGIGMADRIKQGKTIAINL